MVFKCKGKKVPGPLPKQMEILEREKRFRNFWRNVLISLAHDYFTTWTAYHISLLHMSACMVFQQTFNLHHSINQNKAVRMKWGFEYYVAIDWGWIQWMFICIWILVSLNRIRKISNKLSRHFFVFQKWACTSTLETYMWRLNHCLLRAHTFAKQVYFVGTRFICGVWISSSNQSILVFSQFLFFHPISISVIHISTR